MRARSRQPVDHGAQGAILTARADPGRRSRRTRVVQGASNGVPTIGELLTGGRLVTSIAGVLVVALVAGRLLGTKRSASATAVSALVGWTAGATLAVVLARNHEKGDAGFTRNLWLFSTFFAMSASVWMEMLAKPGALARAQRDLRIPHPVRAVRNRTRRLRRYAQISRIIARHGLGRMLGISDDTAVDGADPFAVRVRHALEECGGMFVKMGQILSTRSDLVPPNVVRELERLQDHVAAAPRADVEVLVAADLDALDRLARAVEARAPWAAEYRVVDLVGEFRERLREELDFRIEARNATEISAQLAPAHDIAVPRVFHELTTARLMVMELFDGVSVRQAQRIDDLGLDRGKLADGLLRC